MPKQLLINLPVANPDASKAFYASLALPLNEKLSDEKATCFNLDENIIVALLPASHFKETIYGNEVAAPNTSEMQLAIGLDSKQAVNDLLDKAVAAGGHEVQERVDLPEIYAGTFQDLDGHLWNVFCM